MKAIILVGGKGTRTQLIDQSVPKCLLPVSGQAVVEYPLTCCEQAICISEIIVITHHHADAFDTYLKKRQSPKSVTVITETQPMGTAGAMHCISQQLSDPFVIIYGDLICAIDIDRFVSFHQDKKGLATLLVHPNDHPFDSDIVECLPDGKIEAIHSKPRVQQGWYPNCVSAACYVCSPQILNHIPANRPSDFGRDIFPKLVQTDTCYGYRSSEYCKDMGTRVRYQHVESDVKADKLNRYRLSNLRPTVFLDRDGVINKERSFIKTPEELILHEFSAEAIRCLNHTGFLVIVITNQSAIARNLCTEKTLQEIHWKMETLLGEEGAFVDYIYYCPHHPDKGFPEENITYKIECDCRKPKTGMIKQACKDFPIDLSNSFFVGDSERDIICGQKAGVHTIGVETGNGTKGKTKPHKKVKNLLEATDYIVNYTQS